jgi:sulfide:quinone oxidoreductase
MSARVLIVGAGVAGLETLAALRKLAGERIDITLLAPELKFVNHSMCAAQPFKPRRVRGIPLARVAADFGAYWCRDELQRVDAEKREALTRSGRRLQYDKLVLALGARQEPNFSPALTFRNGRDGPNYRLVLKRLRTGALKNLAFVKPWGPAYLLPLYDLALLTAAECARAGRGIDISLITPEEEPLGVFGQEVSSGVARLLAENGVRVHARSYGLIRRSGGVELRPGGQALRAQQVVTVPRLFARHLCGVPFDSDGFIPVDGHGRVRGLDHAWAAGDATNFPLKQGGLAAQQADAVAEDIAASVGVDVEPRPFSPILRSVLLTGAEPHYLRADLSGSAGDDSSFSPQPSWFPATKLAARYLTPYLSTRRGSALDVLAPCVEQERDGAADRLAAATA